MTPSPAPPAPPRRSRRSRILDLLVLLVLGWGIVGVLAADFATLGRPAAIPDPGAVEGHRTEPVSFASEDGVPLVGWFVAAHQGSTAAVVLAAGIRGNRLAMLSRAGWYLARGWSVLLVDLRATGGSGGERVGFGWHEAKDLRACHRWLRERGMQRLGAHGQSLGAAAIAFSGLPWDFVVLEACYHDLDTALAARLPWVPWPGLLLWPLRAAGQWLADVDAAALRPVDALRARTGPTLLLVGGDDTKGGERCGERLLEACGAADKRLVVVPGAGHDDLFAANRDAVVAALAEFVPPAR